MSSSKAGTTLPDQGHLHSPATPHPASSADPSPGSGGCSHHLGLSSCSSSRLSLSPFPSQNEQQTHLQGCGRWPSPRSGHCQNHREPAGASGATLKWVSERTPLAHKAHPCSLPSGLQPARPEWMQQGEHKPDNKKNSWPGRLSNIKSWSITFLSGFLC